MINNLLAPKGAAPLVGPEHPHTSGIPERFTHPIVSEAPRRDTVLPQFFVKMLEVANATPDVANIERGMLQNTVAQTVTNFLHGQPGQRLVVLGDSFTTLQNGGRIFTNTAANKLLLANKVYRFTYFNSNWYEDA
jgi:hypothetical protein